ncbi:IS110 family transposase [Aerococcaceae bacterium INB8]|uniref:IS110 family transposase n=1 Tax=Ruoffia halotolerans TaxID=2748684 RepID=A0A839A5C0_9LACT|nr:transposase [Ruoffia halotolerans]MBA5729207.1 IS110 family transposase [Ruoffia halotolerans]
MDRLLLEDSLDRYRFCTQKIDRLTQDIEVYILDYFPTKYEPLLEVLGIKETGAATILGEIGPNVDAFSSVENLASWAGLSLSSYKSAGIKKSSRTTRGNNYLKTVLVRSGGVTGRSKEPAFNQLYYRLSNKGSKMKAVIACAHKLLRIVYKLLKERIHYNVEKALGQLQQRLVHK